MKNLLFIAIIIGIFTACNSNPKKTVADSTAVTTTPADSSAIIINQFKPYIDGVWVAEDYVDDIKKTSSPYLSFKKLAGVASIEIHLTSTAKDSIVVGYNLNNHEGPNFSIYLKHGHASNFLKIGLPDFGNLDNYCELGYEVSPTDTLLQLNRYDKAHQLVGHKFYKRVADKSPSGDMAYGVNLIVNKTLIAGNYTLADTSGKQTTVSFGTKGEVSGLSNYKGYNIATDFMVGPENNMDQIYLDSKGKKQADAYVYKIYGDTLMLYKPLSDNKLLSIGALKYKLGRVH